LAKQKDSSDDTKLIVTPPVEEAKTTIATETVGMKKFTVTVPNSPAPSAVVEASTPAEAIEKFKAAQGVWFLPYEPVVTE
jgi:hypothetical protein